MKKSENIKSIDVYDYDDEYCIDIITTNDTYEAWLYQYNCGMKSLMFGMPIPQQSKEQFLEIVEANVEDYIPLYCDEIDIFEEAMFEKAMSVKDE